MFITLIFCIKSKIKGCAFIACLLSGFIDTGFFAWYHLDIIQKAHCDQTYWQGVILDLPQIKANGAYVQVRHLHSHTVSQLRWHDPAFSLKPGQILQLESRQSNVTLDSLFFSSSSEVLRQPIACEGEILNAEVMGVARGHWLAKMRYAIQQHIRTLLQNESRAGIIEALILGTRDNIHHEEKTAFQETGTSHLIAISGLHIGMVSTAAYLLLCFLGRYLPISRTACVFFACGVAFIYAALAGFSHPTVRALVMIFAFLLANVTRRATSAADRLGLALFGVIILDPFSALFLSFWLSFSAVAALVLLSMRKIRYFESTALQIMMSLILIPITLLFFQKINMVSPIANLIAIPIFSLITVPAAFVATLLMSVSKWAALYLYQLSALSINGLLVIFEFLRHFSWNTWAMPQDAHVDLILGLIAVGLFFTFPNRTLRMQSCMMMLPLLIRMLFA